MSKFVVLFLQSATQNVIFQTLETQLQLLQLEKHDYQ